MKKKYVPLTSLYFSRFSQLFCTVSIGSKIESRPASKNRRGPIVVSVDVSIVIQASLQICPLRGNSVNKSLTMYRDRVVVRRREVIQQHPCFW